MTPKPRLSGLPQGLLQSIFFDAACTALDYIGALSATSKEFSAVPAPLTPSDAHCGDHPYQVFDEGLWRRLFAHRFGAHSVRWAHAQHPLLGDIGTVEDREWRRRFRLRIRAGQVRK